ncbi:S53 family peptidase [Paraconexibacter antarcticus]|uniref:S53 family peptidase n=1 Tax=Paraconexibacter antarcticus TaxID=2949664 RepID=A0ABY5DUM9_9ACTN|nr:S53 family peptidase [Paraconexibacter antarcticus]UTI64365.1 S53 family peptidase [Paraconexibacter antarcticus]
MVVLVALTVSGIHPAQVDAATTTARSHRPVCGAAARGFVRCDADVVTNESAVPLVTSAPAGYGPGDLQAAYGLSTLSSASGSSQTVAIVDAYDDPNAEADLATYRARFGLLPCTSTNGCFTKVNQRGTSAYPAPDASWAQEISLDLDMVSAICPSCHILLVEADSASMRNIGAAVDRAATLGATQITNSYGGDEYSGELADDAHYDHPGIAITASSGDSGYGVQFPAASAHVTAVGGTQLVRDTGSTRGWNETAWTGAGSGCSAYIPKPTWQTDTGCAGRTVADVSAVADPQTGVAVYDSFTYAGAGGWMVFGGTSAAAPIVAAYDALIGPTAATLGYPYGHLRTYTNVLTGSNGTCTLTYLCSAAAGYDGPTGVGTIYGAPTPTPTPAPKVATQPASLIGPYSATANATVDPDGTPTSAFFDYGTTTAYGLRTTPQTVGADAGTHQIAALVVDLLPATTYHFRAALDTGSGPVFGEDQTFTTPTLPTLTSPAPSSPSTPAPTEPVLATPTTPSDSPTTLTPPSATLPPAGDKLGPAPSRQPAALRVRHARLRLGRLQLLSTITPLANTDPVFIILKVGRQTLHFTTRVTNGRLRLDRPLPHRLRGPAAYPAVTITYLGNPRVRPATRTEKVRSFVPA